LAESIELSELISSQDILSNTDNSEPIPELFFSYRERRWRVRKSYESWAYRKPKFFWTGEVEIWDYPACNISLVRSSDAKLKIIIRRKEKLYSDFRRKNVEIRLMIGFDLERIYKPWRDIYRFRENEGEREVIEGPKERFVFQFNDNCWIWEWADKGEKQEDSNIYRLYKLIIEEISNPSIKSDNLFDVRDVEDIVSEAEKEYALKNIIPIIYQPAIDSMKNYVRIVNCAHCKTAEGYLEIEVSLIFNNEQLRRYSFINNIYQGFRHHRYGRILDIETFRIRYKDGTKGKFLFQNIYSGKYRLEQDSIHGDSRESVPEHDIRYYFNTEKHPVLFINTSNHAMAEHDSNKTLWKWEYVPWLENSPVRLEEKNRTYIEDESEEGLTKEIESKPFLGRYILKMIQRYRKMRRLLPS
jgi:hypothetical protein